MSPSISRCHQIIEGLQINQISLHDNIFTGYLIRVPQKGPVRSLFIIIPVDCWRQGHSYNNSGLIFYCNLAIIWRLTTFSN